MRKIILLLLCLICMLTACKQSNITSDTSLDAVSNNTDSKVTVSNEDETNNPYVWHDISDERITIVENKKVFSNLGITVSVPADWRCMELNGEDGSSYIFHHPDLGEKCKFSFSLTAAELLTSERNEEEYLEYLSNIYQDVKIDSFTKEKISGYQSTKVVSSYSLENTKFIKIYYDYVIVGFRFYSFTLTYPASESETFEPVFDSIVNSIEFKTE